MAQIEKFCGTGACPGHVPRVVQLNRGSTAWMSQKSYGEQMQGLTSACAPTVKGSLGKSRQVGHDSKS